MNRDPKAGRPHRRPTQADVARLAGVSVPLVSAVVSGSPGSRTIGASTETRQRVWDAVRTLGYTPNVAARSLAGGSNKLISVFTYDPVFPAESQNFYHEFFVGIEQEADARGYSLLLVTSSRNAQGDRAIYVDGSNSLQLADGAVILGGHHPTGELARLSHDGFPFVHIGRRDVDGAEISYIGADYEEGTVTATRALVELGHHRIGFAATGIDAPPALERQAGFVRARRELSLTADETPIIPSRSGAVLDHVLSHRLTGVILETTWEANRLRRDATAKGISVPGDLSIISLGGLSRQGSRPRMARLVIPRKEMGRRAVGTLVELLANPSHPPVQQLLPCELRLEHTVAPPPPHSRDSAVQSEG